MWEEIQSLSKLPKGSCGVLNQYTYGVIQESQKNWWESEANAILDGLERKLHYWKSKYLDDAAFVCSSTSLFFANQSGKTKGN